MTNTNPKAKAKKPAKRSTAKRKAETEEKNVIIHVDGVEYSLTPKMWRFVQEMPLNGWNGSKAARAAGYSARSSGSIAAENLKKPAVLAALSVVREGINKAAELDATRVVREAWNIMTADARELSYTIVYSCRFCHGIGHRWQRNDAEYETDLAEHIKKEGSPEGFNAKGGPGYDPRRPPNPDCPECVGVGLRTSVIGDTSKLSREAVSLYAGAKKTKNGHEVLTHNKIQAMEAMFKHFGLYQRDNEQRMDPLQELIDAVTQNSNNGFSTVRNDPEQLQQGDDEQQGSTIGVSHDVEGD